MARPRRMVVAGQPHHVLQRGNDRQLIFRDDQDRRMFLDWLREAARQLNVAIHSYVLMPNHVHLLASPAEADGLSRMMQWIGRHYVPYFNRKYDRVGTLFQGRFKAIVIESERYFLVCSRYIELNPVRAGMVISPAEFAWSSYTHHAGIRSDPMLTDHVLYWSLGNTPFQREAAYRALMEQGLSTAEVAAVTEATFKGWPLASVEFKGALQKRLQRPVGPVRRGRPARNASKMEK